MTDAAHSEVEETRYYLDDYSDEMPPCNGTLKGWADWLSTPDVEWGRTESARDGETFACSMQRFLPDIIASRGADRWTFSREPCDDCALVAVRFGEGLGWSSDSIIWGEDMRTALREWFEENDILCDDVEFIAIAINGPKSIATYHSAPSPHLTLSIVQ